MATSSFKTLSQCEAGEFVRIQINESDASLAIVGSTMNGNMQFMVIIESDPYTIQLKNGLYTNDLLDRTVISYGKCLVRHEFDSRCNIDKGDLFDKSGAIICTNDSEQYIVASHEKGSLLINVKTGSCAEIAREPRAAYSAWVVYLQDRERPDFIFSLDTEQPPHFY